MAPLVGWGSVACQRLTENIIVLGILTNQQAGQPSENNMPSQITPSRQLPIERERDLVHMFAFLSATRDDPKRVMAVCLDEHVQKTAMTIRVAANRGDLSDLKEELKKIAHVLESVSKRSQSTSKGRDLLLQHIISMDEARILSRLCIDHKHSHWQKQGRRFPFSRLRNMLSNVLHACSPLNPPSSEGDALRRMDEIEMLHADVSRKSGKEKDRKAMHASMTKLLKLCDSLTTHRKFHLPHKTCTEDKIALEKLKKLGRYHTISRDLIAAARNSRYEVFNHIKIEVVNIYPSWSVKPKPPVSLTSSLENACGPANAQTAKDLVKTFIQSPSGKATYNRKQDELNEGLSRVPKSWKVHAEMQLLLYYELHPGLQKPRVICSNKDACYLCNLFIKAHNTYHIPRTHGKLYDTWCIPDLTAELEPGANIGRKSLRKLNGAVEMFNALLEKRIRQILSGAKIFYQAGNVESTLLPYNAWSTSVLSYGGSASAIAAAARAYDDPDPAQGTMLSIENPQFDAERVEVPVEAVATQERGASKAEQPVSSRVEACEAVTTPVLEHDSQEEFRIIEHTQAAESVHEDKHKPLSPAAAERKTENRQEMADRAAAYSLQACNLEPDDHNQVHLGPLQQHARSILNSSPVRAPLSRPQTPSALANRPIPRGIESPPRNEIASTPRPAVARPVNADTSHTFPAVNVDDDDDLEHAKASPWHALSEPESNLTFRSPNLSLDLSQIWDSHSSQRTLVRARLLLPEEKKKVLGDDGRRRRRRRDVVDAKALRYDENITLTRGSALSRNVLYISSGVDVVAIQYSYAEPLPRRSQMSDGP